MFQKLFFKRVISPFIIVGVLLFNGLPSTSHAAEIKATKSNVNSKTEVKSYLILPIGLDYYWGQAQAEDAAARIPKRLKKSDDVVDLGKFKDKYGNTPKTKNSGEFTNGDWSIEKDITGHTGYDGSVKKWKIKKNGERIASLNKDGKVIDK